MMRPTVPHAFIKNKLLYSGNKTRKRVRWMRNAEQMHQARKRTKLVGDRRGKRTRRAQ